jgi:hypothetical protein
MSFCRNIHFSTDLTRYPGADVKLGADWNRKNKICFKTGCYGWGANQPHQFSKSFIESQREQATVCQTWRSLVILCHSKYSGEILAFSYMRNKV